MLPVGKGVSGGKGKRGKPCAASVSERKLFFRLLSQMQAQTEAIARLAASNEALVEALMSEDHDPVHGPDFQPRTL